MYNGYLKIDDNKTIICDNEGNLNVIGSNDALEKINLLNNIQEIEKLIEEKEDEIDDYYTLIKENENKGYFVILAIIITTGIFYMLFSVKYNYTILEIFQVLFSNQFWATIIFYIIATKPLLNNISDFCDNIVNLENDIKFLEKEKHKCEAKFKELNNSVFKENDDFTYINPIDTREYLNSIKKELYTIDYDKYKEKYIELYNAGVLNKYFFEYDRYQYIKELIEKEINQKDLVRERKK